MSRLDLHNKLLGHSDNVYFQPPSTIQMKYPCIVYSKTPKYREFSNDSVYIKLQGYQLTVIDRNPDSLTADDLEDEFIYCAISQYFTHDNLNHITLDLYY